MLTSITNGYRTVRRQHPLVRLVHLASRDDLVQDLRLWRGKVFEHNKHNAVTGFNRLGVGPLEVKRFQFTARVAQSLFSDREVVFLDHDSANNPGYVRRFHDELVAIDEGLYLATSHYREGERLRYLCHFALAKPARA